MNRITAAKEKLHLDDARLATLLGVHRTTITRMERRGVVSGPVALLLDKILANPDGAAEPSRDPADIRMIGSSDKPGEAA